MSVRPARPPSLWGSAPMCWWADRTARLRCSRFRSLARPASTLRPALPTCSCGRRVVHVAEQRDLSRTARPPALGGRLLSAEMKFGLAPTLDQTPFIPAKSGIQGLSTRPRLGLAFAGTSVIQTHAPLALSGDR